jgi:hypothetical protein
VKVVIAPHGDRRSGGVEGGLVMGNGRISCSKKIPSVLILLGILICPRLPGQEQPMDRLILYGDGFRFGVKEPAGWHGDWQTASSMKSNIIFYPEGHETATAYGVIRVRVNKKKDENTGEGLAADMEGFRRRFPAIEFKDLDVKHPFYPCFSKLFSLEGRFHEYLAYLNPGPEYWFIFSVAMNTGTNPATESELAAFGTVASSLLTLGAGSPSSWGEDDFDAALKAANDNLQSKKGKRYDADFALKAGPWLANAMAHCTKELPDSDLCPFTILVRVNASGIAEEVLAWPITKVARCLKPLFACAMHPKPPGPSWWVKMDVLIH